MRRVNYNTNDAGGGAASISGGEGFEEQGGDAAGGIQHKRYFSEVINMEAYLHEHSLKSPCLAQSGFYGSRDRSLLQPHYSYLQQVKIPYANRLNPADGICTHFLRKCSVKPILRFYNREAMNAQKPVSACMWTANGRWLVLGAQKATEGNPSTGYGTMEALPEFSLYDPETLAWDRTIVIGTVDKECAITKMTWNTHGNNFATSYDNGSVQLFDDTFRSIGIINAHQKASRVNGLSFAPNDASLATCGDDKMVKVWDVRSFQPGHSNDDPKLSFNDLGSEVKCLDWHPFRSLISVGTKDGKIKLYDPKQGSCVSTITSTQKKDVTNISFNQNGNWLASGGKDAYVRVFDIRMCKEIEAKKGHNCDVSSLAWHPVHESVLVTGGYNGSLIYWVVGQQDSLHTAIAQAHKWCIEVLTWHPLGHYLGSISQDGWMKFWSREPPGSVLDEARCSAPYPSIGYMNMKVTDFIGEMINMGTVKFGYGPLGLAKATTDASGIAPAIPDVIQQTSASVRYEGFQPSLTYAGAPDTAFAGNPGAGSYPPLAGSGSYPSMTGGGDGQAFFRAPFAGGRGRGRGRFVPRGGR
jgi:hypothetical protein